MMAVANDQALLRKVLSDTIPLLCKTSLGLFNSSFSVEAIVGITVNETDIVLVSFKETVLPDGSTVSLTWQRDGVDTVETAHSAGIYGDGTEDANDEATSAHESTQVLYDATNSGSNDALETMEEAHLVSGQTSLTQPLYKEDKDWKDVEEYSYQASSTRYHSTENAEDDGVYKYSAEPADWESVGKALHSESSVGDVDEIDCSIVKIEKREMEMDFGLTSPHKPGPKLSRDETMRSGHSVFQRGLRRRGLAGGRRVVPRSGLQFAQKRLQVKKQPAMTSHTAGKHSSRVQQWSNDASASQGMPQDPYESMADVLCRTAMQQTVTVEKQYICRICQARLSSTNNLMAHIQGTHLALDRYQCHICLEKFRWYMQLHRHRKRCHSDMFPPSAL